MPENTAKRGRTRERMKNALIELCDEKPYYDITIEDVCGKAGVYRSTFYRYYNTKDELLREVEHEYLAETRSLTTSFDRFAADASPEELDRFRAELVKDMEYHRERRKLCKFLLSPGGDLYFYEKMRESISGAVRRNYQLRGKSVAGHRKYVVSFFAAGFIETIQTWLEIDDCTAEQMADTLLQMMTRLHVL